jgi:hypothetical protein
VSSGVRALAPIDGDLIAAGEFTMAGGMPVNHVAGWDGAFWHPFGAGTNGVVHAVAPYAGEIVVGGQFTLAGDEPANFVAAWDGAAWHPLGEGMNGIVRGLELHAGLLVATGGFSMAGGVTALNLASWDGAAWAPLGGGLDGPGYDLRSIDGSLFVGGDFTQAGEQRSLRVARWFDAAAAVPEEPPLPRGALRLLSAGPNPSRTGWKLEFEIAHAQSVRIRLFDVAGRLRRTIFDAPCSPGPRAVFCEGRDGNGSALLPGVYFARLEAHDRTETIKLVRIR